jgi:hypothetical protein
MNNKRFQSFDLTKINNAIAAEDYVRGLCKEINGKHDSVWCKDFFTKTFPRLVNTRIGRELLGLEKGDKREYYYVANSF